MGKYIYVTVIKMWQSKYYSWWWEIWTT